MNKDITPENISQILWEMRQAGVRDALNVLLKFAGEKKAAGRIAVNYTLQQAIDRVRKLIGNQSGA